MSKRVVSTLFEPPELSSHVVVIDVVVVAVVVVVFVDFVVQRVSFRHSLNHMSCQAS